MLFEKFRRKKEGQKEAIVEKDEIKVEEIVNKASDSNENDFEVDVQEIGNEELKNKRLVEITDKNILVHINHLIPSLFKTANAAMNVSIASKLSNGSIYQAILPSGAKLAASHSMNDAVRGFYLGENGIAGQANFKQVDISKMATISNSVAAIMNVASLIVGQYYMSEINSKLAVINDSISEIQDFQNNEYKSRVFSLVTSVKTIADFHEEILENDELRISKINSLERLQEDCMQLLEQANLTISGISKKQDLKFKQYEKEVAIAEEWSMYQKLLLEVLYRIADLKYALYFGAVSRKQCSAIIPECESRAEDSRKSLEKWHADMIEKLQIDIEKDRRKLLGDVSVVNDIFSLIGKDKQYVSVDKKTATMIKNQTGKQMIKDVDKSELYSKDVRLISKDGKVYYLLDKE